MEECPLSTSLPGDRSDELLATATAVARDRLHAPSRQSHDRRRRLLLWTVGSSLGLAAGGAAVWSIATAGPNMLEGSIASAVTAPQTSATALGQPDDSAVASPLPSAISTTGTTVASPSTEAVPPSPAPTIETTVSPAPDTTMAPTTIVSTPVETVLIPVPEGPVERFSFEIADDGKAYMRGSLPDVATAEAVAAKGALVVGSEGVVAEYTVDPRVVLDVEQEDEGFVTQTLLYPPGIANLQPEHVYPLDQVVVLLIASPQLVAFVEGYTDSDGDAAENLSLSRSRARVVSEYLIRQGVNPAQLIETVGKGEESPLGDNATVDGRSLNRRVDIHLNSPG